MLQLNEEAAFYENDGYRYSGVYVQYFLKKFGMDAFRNVYTGKDRLAVYLYDGFEAEAIQNAKA